MRARWIVTTLLAACASAPPPTQVQHGTPSEPPPQRAAAPAAAAVVDTPAASDDRADAAPPGAPDPDLDREAARIAELLGGAGAAAEEVLGHAGGDELGDGGSEDYEDLEIILDVATGEVTGGPDWLEQPIARQRAGLRGCGRRFTAAYPVRGTLVLDRRGRVTDIRIGHDDLDRCAARFLREARFDPDAGRLPSELHVRLVFTRR